MNQSYDEIIINLLYKPILIYNNSSDKLDINVKKLFVLIPNYDDIGIFGYSSSKYSFVRNIEYFPQPYDSAIDTKDTKSTGIVIPENTKIVRELMDKYIRVSKPPNYNIYYVDQFFKEGNINPEMKGYYYNITANLLNTPCSTKDQAFFDSLYPITPTDDKKTLDGRKKSRIRKSPVKSKRKSRKISNKRSKTSKKRSKTFKKRSKTFKKRSKTSKKRRKSKSKQKKRR